MGDLRAANVVMQSGWCMARAVRQNRCVASKRVFDMFERQPFPRICAVGCFFMQNLPHLTA